MKMLITADGFDAGTALMRDLALDLQRPVLKKALTTAAGPIVFRAKRNARSHDDSGLLADSIGVTVKVDRAGRGVANIRPYGKTVMVTQTGPDGVKRQRRTRATSYAHHVEFGTKHVSARPYMRPAMDGGKSEAVAGFKAEVQAAIDKRTRKAARDAKRKARNKSKSR